MIYLKIIYILSFLVSFTLYIIYRERFKLTKELLYIIPNEQTYLIITFIFSLIPIVNTWSIIELIWIQTKNKN